MLSLWRADRGRQAPWDSLLLRRVQGGGRRHRQAACATRKTTAPAPCDRGRVLSVAFSPDSQTLVTSSGDRTARLWEASKGRASLTLHGHSQAVESAQFSTDGARVVTASQDGTLRVWDVRPEEHEPALVSALLRCRVALRLDNELNILPSPLTGLEPGCDRLPAIEEAPPQWQDRDRELLTILYALRADQGSLAQRFVPRARAAHIRIPSTTREKLRTPVPHLRQGSRGPWMLVQVVNCRAMSGKRWGCGVWPWQRDVE